MVARWVAMAIAALTVSAVAACAAAAPSPTPSPAAFVPTPFVPPSYVPPSYVPPSYVPPSYVPPSYVPPSYVPPIVRPPDPVSSPSSYVPPSYVPPSFVPLISRPPDTFSSPPPGAQSGPPQPGPPGQPAGDGCASATAVSSRPSLNGSTDLFDQHMHVLFAGGPNTAPLDDPARVTIANGVAQAVVFVVSEADRDDCFVKQGLQRHPGRFVPFIVPRALSAPAIDRTRSVIEDPATPYRGVGEVTFYLQDALAYSLMSGPAAASFDALFRSMEQRGMVLYTHMRHDQEADFTAMLRAHPALKVVAHGYPGPDGAGGQPMAGSAAAVAAMLRAYPNFYYSLDVMNLLAGGKIAMSSASAFLAGYDQGRQPALDWAWTTWRDVIAAFPDRIFWGTDVDTWKYDAEVHRRFIDFSRAFIAGLPAGVQRGYAYANAARVMGAPQ